jgi:hypothetical protein
LHVELDEDPSIQASKDAEEDERDEFKIVPSSVIRDLVQDQFTGSEGVESLQRDCSDHGTNKALPHGLIWKVKRQLLQTKEHTANRRAKGNRNAGSGSGGKYFPFSR